MMPAHQMTTDPSATRRARLRQRLLWIGLALLAVLISLPLVGYVVYDWQGRQLLQAEIDKTVGEPLTTDELTAFQTLPAGAANTTDQWLAVLQSFEDRDYKEMEIFMPIMGISMKLPPLPEPIPDEDRVAIEHFLAINRPKLERIEKLMRDPGEPCFPRDFSDVPLAFQLFNQLRSAQKLLELAIELAVRDGDVTTALRHLQTQLRLANALRHQLGSTDFLIRVAITGVALSNTRKLLQHRQLNDEQLAQLQATVAEITLHPQLYHAMLDERGLAFKGFHVALPRNAEGHELLAVADSSRDAGGIRRPHDCALMLEFMNRACAASQLPLPQALPAIEQIDDEIETLLNDERAITRWKYWVTRLYFENFRSLLPMTQAVTRVETELALVNTRLGVQRYLLKHNQPPATVEALAPDFLTAVPVDPFDGQPLRYRADADRLVIYSVGYNRADDAGATDPLNHTALDMAEVVSLAK